jgi:hypothetical protein
MDDSILEEFEDIEELGSKHYEVLLNGDRLQDLAYILCSYEHLAIHNQAPDLLKILNIVDDIKQSVKGALLKGELLMDGII